MKYVLLVPLIFTSMGCSIPEQLADTPYTVDEQKEILEMSEDLDKSKAEYARAADRWAVSDISWDTDGRKTLKLELDLVVTATNKHIEMLHDRYDRIIELREKREPTKAQLYDGVHELLDSFGDSMTETGQAFDVVFSYYDDVEIGAREGSKEELAILLNAVSASNKQYMEAVDKLAAFETAIKEGG